MIDSRRVTTVSYLYSLKEDCTLQEQPRWNTAFSQKAQLGSFHMQYGNLTINSDTGVEPTNFFSMSATVRLPRYTNGRYTNSYR